jgi:hypothetical protein
VTCTEACAQVSVFYAMKFAAFFTSSKRQRVGPVFLPNRGKLTRWRFVLVFA